MPDGPRSQFMGWQFDTPQSVCFVREKKTNMTCPQNEIHNRCSYALSECNAEYNLIDVDTF